MIWIKRERERAREICIDNEATRSIHTNRSNNPRIAYTR